MTDNGMWEDLESHRRPRGVSEAEAKRAEGVDPSSTLGGASAANADPPSSSAMERCTAGTPYGQCTQNGRMIAYGGWHQVRCDEHTPEGATIVESTSSGDIQARLSALVTEMRRRQPTESQWLDHPELRRLRADVDHLQIIVAMVVEVCLNAAEKAEAA